MPYTPVKHLEYNLWANSKLGEFISKADEKLFDTEVVSSFSSLRQTVYHVWDAEAIWLMRLQGVSPNAWPSKIFQGSRDECLSQFIQNSKAFHDFILSQKGSFIESNILYKNLKGDEFQSTAEEIIMHVVNHGAFHRGQMITILRTLGFTQLGSTDLITFLRLQKSSL